MKDELLNLYSKYWDGYIENVRKVSNSAYPFLIVPRDNYCTAKNRIMICGQETQGWCNELDNKNPEEVTPKMVMSFYNGFVNGGAYSSSYWHFGHRLEKMLPEAGFVYNNIVKIGKRRSAGCDDSIYRLSLKHFPVYRKELDILNPDVIIFLTGKYYDWRIRETLGDFRTEVISPGIFIERIIFNDSSIPTAYRTYHPRYIIQILKKYKEYSRILVDEISSLL